LKQQIEMFGGAEDSGHRIPMVAMAGVIKAEQQSPSSVCGNFA